MVGIGLLVGDNVSHLLLLLAKELRRHSLRLRLGQRRGPGQPAQDQASRDLAAERLQVDLGVRDRGADPSPQDVSNVLRRLVAGYLRRAGWGWWGLAPLAMRGTTCQTPA